MGARPAKDTGAAPIPLGRGPVAQFGRAADFYSVGETMVPPRAPFVRDRLNARGVATAAARAEEKERGNLPVSPHAPSTVHGPQVGP
jgi:hypothetical protein